MAVEHRERRAAAVQFHPESILTGHEIGMRILRNAIEFLSPGRAPALRRAD